MDRTIGEIIEDVGGRREPPRLDLLSEAVDYIRGLSNEQYEQLHTALEGILRHARGEAVPELLGYAAIVNAHLRQLQLREGAPKSGSDIR